jgi:predicted RNA-binding protein YlqC (UPF0109 family)
MLKNLVEYIVKSLVDKPDLVQVTQTVDSTRVTLKIKVNELDLGRVIGKDGQTIRAIRALASARLAQGQEVIIDVSK